ncbi:MAG: hypothetical protein JW891_16995 [Candidatus Lokiarchaeota archaeon]|nr:hypothetical protein [Candidatus Lokiarchaeota archaeon]
MTPSKNREENVLKGQIPEIEKPKILVFQFNDHLGDFEELEIDEDLPLHELLDPEFIVLFVDPEHYRVWVWHGSNTTTRMKFIAAKLAPTIRDKYGIAFKITAVDDGGESKPFKVMVGLEDEAEEEKEQTGPAYAGTNEDLELIKSLSREKILLLLEKTEIPEGFIRKMVLVKNTLYGYKEFERNYLGSVIKEKQLFPLKEDVPDGTYLAENYIPRMLFSFNNVVLTEFLQKIPAGESK